MSPWAMLETACRVGRTGDDERQYFVGCVGVRGDGAVVQARNGAARLPCRQHHAEYRCVRKMDVGGSVFVGRTLVSGVWAMARPCHACFRVLWSRGVVRVYYTIGDREWGCVKLGQMAH